MNDGKSGWCAGTRIVRNEDQNILYITTKFTADQYTALMNYVDARIDERMQIRLGCDCYKEMCARQKAAKILEEKLGVTG